MNLYGSDKPDLRFDMKIIDFKSFLLESEFQAFKEVEMVKGLIVKNGTKFSRKISMVLLNLLNVIRQRFSLD